MTMRFRLRAAAATAALALAAVLAAAAHPAAADMAPNAGGAKRPKICLVLSGGGARGAAHVGVLKVLEEYRVPIDCIAGTSMGALIGAGYATGSTVAEMEQILREITTEVLYKENPPRQEISMRRKQDHYTLLFGPELGVDSTGIKFPKGVVSGVQLETVLRRLAKAKGYHRFDDLPIPFRAVATDLLSGKAVIFSQGELANVMRASMSVPGAVAPAEIDGMMLVDGMLTSNLPVQVARAMGADIIIAVNVGTPLLKREQINGLVGVTGQMLSILTEQNVQASLARLQPADVLVSPELGDYSTGDFDHLPKIAPLGEEAARKLADRLTQLSLPVAEYAALRQSQLAAAEPDLRPVDEIRFERLQRVSPKAAQAAMETKPGQPIDQQTLDQDMRRIYGSGDFEHVNYRFLEEPGRRVLAVDAVEKSWGPDYLRFGLGLSSDFKGGSYFNLLGSYRQTWLNSLGAEWRTDLQFGRSSGLTTEFYQPFDAERSFFIAPRLGFERRAMLLYQGDTNIATYDLRSSLVGLDLGTQFERYGELRLGVRRGELSPTLTTGPAILTPGASDIAQGAYTARLVLDQIDSVHFPRAGWRGGMSLYSSDDRLGADQSYTRWDVDGTAAYSFGEHTFSFGMKFGGKYGSDPLPRYDQFQWGGFLQQSGYATGQLLGENIKFGRVMYYHRILRGSFLEGAYGGFSLEAGKVGNPLVPGSPEGLLQSAGLFLAADSPVGPVYLGYGRAKDGNTSLYFYIGVPF